MSDEGLPLTVQMAVNAANAGGQHRIIGRAMNQGHGVYRGVVNAREGLLEIGHWGDNVYPGVAHMRCHKNYHTDACIKQLPDKRVVISEQKKVREKRKK